MANEPTPLEWQLGPWQVIPSLNRLQNGAEELSLEPRVMTALMVLIEAQGAVVTDEQLLKGVWAGQIVSDASLYKVIAELRKALGDSDKPYQFIERVSGKGYRLIAKAMTAAPAPRQALFSRQEQLQHDPVEQDLNSGWRLDSVREKLSKKASVWLWSFVLTIIALTIWELLPKNDAAPTANVGSAAPAPINQEQKPTSISQELWDNYLQARWLSAQRKPNELNQAIALYQSVLELAPNFTATEVGLCNAYHFQHLYSDWPLSKVMALCEPLLRHALQTDASSAAALASFGLLKQSQGDVEAAATYLDRSLSLVPDDATVLIWRANVYREQGALEKALPLSERAAKLDPLSGLIKRHYAFSLISNGNIGEARQMFKEALLLEPHYSDRAIDELDMLPLNVERAANFLRWAHRFPDRIKEANNPAPAINLALIQLSLAKISDANKSLQIAEQKFPRHQFTLLARAMWHNANGDDRAAQQLLQQRAALQANNPMYRVIALMLANERNPVSMHTEFLDLFPDFSRASQSTVRKYLEQGKGQIVFYWLLSQTESERQRYADTINTWLNSQNESSNLSLNLHLLLGQTEKANDLAMKMLNNDWLPSPNDDFYIAERHPLWRQLNTAFFQQLALARLRASNLSTTND